MFPEVWDVSEQHEQETLRNRVGGEGDIFQSPKKLVT